MRKDIIIDEIHEHREEYLKSMNYNLHAVCEDIKKIETKNGRVVVQPKPRPVSKVNKTA